MTAPTFANMVTMVQAATADSSNSVWPTQCINAAQREVAHARRWAELVQPAFFLTSAAYSTGRIAVANGGTTWTLTGGTFPTDVATGKYRIALSVSDPPYTIVTRTDGTHVETTGQAYAEDTETDSAFIVYKTRYSLAATVDKVEEMWIYRPGGAVPLINAATDNQVTNFLHFPSGPGTPTHFLTVELDASSQKQVILGSEAPDDVWRVEYTYRRDVTDDTFTGNLHQTRWPLIYARALSLAYGNEFYERSQAEYVKYLKLLDQEWAASGDTETQGVRVGQARIDYPGRSSYLDNLLGFGTVADPS